MSEAFPSGFENIDPGLPEGGSEPNPSPSVEDLQAELDQAKQAKARAESAVDLERQRMDSWIRGSHQPTQEQSAVEPLGPMPDAATDPEKFQSWLLERDRRRQVEIENRFDLERDERQAQINQETRAATLWNLFQSKYPVYADRVQIAKLAMQRVAAGGLPSADDQVVEAVKSEMDAMLKVPLDSIKSEANRTDGVQPGDRKTPKKTPLKDPNQSPNSSLNDALFKRQEAIGII